MNHQMSNDGRLDKSMPAQHNHQASVRCGVTSAYPILMGLLSSEVTSTKTGRESSMAILRASLTVAYTANVSLPSTLILFIP